MPSLRLGDEAPEFSANTSKGKFDSFHDFIGDSWAVFFSHPQDFTPVCTTELGQVANLSLEWKKRNVKVIGLSCDELKSHAEWIKDIEETQNVKIDYPIIADGDRRIAKLYDMLDDEKHDQHNIQASTGMPFTVRSVFIIDPSKKIRWMIMYPASCGRNFVEILRAIDSLQTTDVHSIATPANWQVGQQVIIPPHIKSEDALSKFDNVREIKPYLRYACLKSSSSN